MAPDDLAAYLRELSNLGRRYGLGLTGDTQLYKLEPEDALFDYSTDAGDRLTLGASRDGEH